MGWYLWKWIILWTPTRPTPPHNSCHLSRDSPACISTLNRSINGSIYLLFLHHFGTYSVGCWSLEKDISSKSWQFLTKANQAEYFYENEKRKCPSTPILRYCGKGDQRPSVQAWQWKHRYKVIVEIQHNITLRFRLPSPPLTQNHRTNSRPQVALSLQWCWW